MLAYTYRKQGEFALQNMEKVKSCMTSSRVFPASPSASVLADRVTLASITNVLVSPEGVFFANKVMVPLPFLSAGSPEGI